MNWRKFNKKNSPESNTESVNYVIRKPDTCYLIF